MGVSERSNKTRRSTLRAVSAKESAQADHASQEAVRPLTCRLLDPLPLPLPSQPHSTGLTSPKRYDKRYEGKVLNNIDLHQRPTRTWWSRGCGRGATSYLTSFSIDGEHPS